MGQGGDTYSYNRVTQVRNLVSSGGFGDALSVIGHFDQPTWTLGLNFNYPLGMVAAHASFAQAQITLEQSKATLKALELTVSTDVNSAGLAVQNAFLQLQASRKSREAQERTAEATQTRFDAGIATNFEVSTAVNNLTSRAAQRAHLNHPVRQRHCRLRTEAEGRRPVDDRRQAYERGCRPGKAPQALKSRATPGNSQAYTAMTMLAGSVARSTRRLVEGLAAGRMTCPPGRRPGCVVTGGLTASMLL